MGGKPNTGSIDRLRHLLLAALIALLAPGTVALAGAGDAARLKVSRLGSPPAKALAGSSLPVSGKVANRGERGGRARPRIELRAGEERLRLGRVGAGRVGPGAVKAFEGEVEIPAATPAGPYRLAACQRRRGATGLGSCRLAAGTLLIERASEPEQTEPPPTPPEFSPGARSLGDPLFPQIGNGGYDARHYEIELDYDPNLNQFDSATTTMTAIATQNLSELSLDFQDLPVDEVTVDGEPAAFSQEATSPPLGDPAQHTQPRKLVVTPAGGLPSGQSFELEVTYGGTPQRVVDPDGSSEGWIPCVGAPAPLPFVCDGAFVVNEPIGAQGWFPSNNYPSDKASFDTIVTVPEDRTALGVGELVSNEANGDGTRTWHWREDDPTATYLTTATVGRFNYTESSMTEDSTGQVLPVYNAVDVLATPSQASTVAMRLAEAPAMLNFLNDLYGPYPFDSTGAVVDNTVGVNYALEVQTKPHFATPSVPRSTLLHEIAHQWMGNEVTLQTWADIWFNEGWATWSEWYWGHADDPSQPTPAEHFQSEYDSASDEDWALAPAVLDGDPANLFNHFAVYIRGAMTLEGYHQIVGDAEFLEFARLLTAEYAYGNVSTEKVISLALTHSGFTGAKLVLLDEYFQQWLYGETKPTILPEDFA